MVPKTTVAPGTEAFGFIFFVVRVLFFANASATKKNNSPWGPAGRDGSETVLGHN